MSWIEIIAKVLPVLLLILLGVILKRINFISEKSINELKTFIINISLPGLIFLSFLNAEFKLKYIWIVIVVFSVNIIMLFLGKGFNRLLDFKSRYFPLMFTGFEMGMLGFSLFGTVYGVKNLSVLGIVDLGQELYVWFILTVMLTSLKEGSRSLKQTGLSFITSPVIIGILAGLLLNFAGLKGFLSENSLTAGLMNTISMLSQLTIPLILIIIGYQLNLRLDQFSLPAKTLILRMSAMILAAFLIIHFIFSPLLKLPRIFETALCVMFILPPPFIIPLFMNKQEEEQTFVMNTLSLGTMFTLIGFIIFTFLYQ